MKNLFLFFQNGEFLQCPPGVHPQPTVLGPIDGLVDFWSKSVIRCLDLYFQIRILGLLGPINAFSNLMLMIHIWILMSRIHILNLLFSIFFYLSKSKAPQSRCLVFKSILLYMNCQVHTYVCYTPDGLF